MAALHRELAGEDGLGATGGLLAWGLVQKNERGVRNAPAATGRRFGAPGVALIGEGGTAWRRIAGARRAVPKGRTMTHLF